MKKIPFLLCFSLLLFSQCKKDDKPEISIDQPELTFNYDGKTAGENTFSIRSNWDWEIVVNSTEAEDTNWVSFDKSSGHGDAVITVTVYPNLHGSRKADFLIKADDRSKPLTITQHASGMLEILPDPGFRAYCLQYFDTNNDYILSDEEFRAVEIISVSGRIESFKGIERFVSLTTLNCSANNLTELDLSQNTALKALYCYRNQLMALDLSQNTALTELSCGENKLTELDVSANTELVQLYCADNKLEELEVSANTQLEVLYCGKNALTALELSHNELLVGLDCAYNRIESLDLAANTVLKSINCEYNEQLVSLVCPSPSLEYLVCRGNALTAVNVSGNPKLSMLDCGINPLTDITLPDNPVLTHIYCFESLLTTLDISRQTKLETLWCADNPDLNTVYVWEGFTLPETFVYDEHTAFQVKK